MSRLAGPLLVVLLLTPALALAADPPTYKGKPAAEWAKLLADRDDDTRLEAITALVSIGKPKDEPKVVTEATAAKVVPLLDDANALIRAKACRWLAEATRDPKVVKVAAGILSDGKSPAWACADAAKSLESLGAAAREARPAIERQLAAISELGFDVSDPKEPRTQEVASLRAALKAIDANR
jgi:hypothetical protein